MRLGYNARLSLGLIVITVLTLAFCWQTSVYIEKTADNLARTGRPPTAPCNRDLQAGSRRALSGWGC